jgi:hypothetical protein
MKQYIKNIMTMAALLLTVSVAKAAGEVKIIPSDLGTVTSQIADNICTLTVTPANGYYITVGNITAIKIIDGGAAQAPNRTAGIDDEKLEITAVNPTADPSGTTTYTFTMPSEEYDVEVTADFQQRTDIANAVVTLEEGTYVYTGNAYEPAVLSVVLDGKALDSSEYAVSYLDNVNAGTGKVVITGKRTYNGEAVATFEIAKATVSISFSEDEVTIDMTHQKTYKLLPTVSPADMPIHWEIGSPFVGSIDDNGEVSITGIGPTSVAAYVVESTNYKAAIASYMLHVKATYPLTIGDKVLTSDIRADVFGDGTVIFDGRKSLLLSSANLDDVIETTLEDLTVYVEGTCHVKGFKGTGKILFTTEGNTPGTLMLKNVGGEVLDGFPAVVYDQNMAFIYYSDDGSEATIGTPVKPVVTEEAPVMNVKMADIAKQDLSNKVINDVVYNVPQADDQPVQTDEGIVLTSAMVEDDVVGVIANYTPTTEEYAKEFAGLTLMVQAGTGNISLTVKTGAEGVLIVRVGMDVEAIIQGAIDFQEFVVPYAVTEASYVYIYNGSEPVAEAPSNRASKKTSVTVGIRTVGVTADAVQPSNEMGNSIRTVAESDNAGKEISEETAVTLVETTEEAATIGDEEVAELSDDVFTNVLDGFVGSIDLRNTSVTGLTVSRSEGAFKGVSKNTFIYIPAGNKSGEGEENVIIGNICPKAMLNMDMAADESFNPSSEFTAQQIDLNRTFGDTEVATVYLPFDMTFAQASMLGTFYTVGKIANGYVKIDEVTSGKLTAHTPYLFRANTSKISLRVITVKTPPTDERHGAPAVEEDGLRGCYSRTTTAGYRLTGSDISNLSFERMSGGDVIRPFEAYLSLADESYPSLTVTDDESVVTGICDATRHNGKEDYNVYDLQGRKISNTQLSRGVYIRHGKKMIVE